MGSKLGPNEVKRRLTASDKQARAAELSALGWSFRRIATELGYAGPSGVKKAIEGAIKKAPSKAVEVLRADVDERSRIMLEELMPIVKNRKIPRDVRFEAMDRVVKIDKELRALHGADAPTSIRFDLSKMNDDQLRQIVGDGAREAPGAGASGAEEKEVGGDEAPLEGGAGTGTSA